MDKVIELVNIDKFYGDKVKTQVLYDINLSIQKGSFNSIIGQSGSGKSTLLNIMGTLDSPTRGQIIIDEKDVSLLDSNRLAGLRNELIGFVFQFHHLLPEFTALENVMMPYLIKDSSPPRDMFRRAEELMDMVGLEKVRNAKANEMSGGQQQRTAIARALMNRPKIILADEPTGNLDSDSAESVYELMRNINKQFRTTFIIVTHDKKIAERADRIIEIKDGRIQ